MTVSPKSRAPRSVQVALAVLLMIVPVGLLGLGHESASAGKAAKGPYCGAAVPKPTGGTWKCTFVDEFAGTALDTNKWVPIRTYANGYRNGPECYVNSPENISVANGALSLSVRKYPKTFYCSSPFGNFYTDWTAGYVSTWNRFAQTYGRFEIRAKFPDAKTRGIHSALWLWPKDAAKYGAYPASGEIDIAEFYSHWPDRAVPYVHYVGDDLDAARTSESCMVTAPENWHTYVLVWTAKTLTIQYDGKTCLVNNWQPTTLTKPAPFDQPFYLNLTQALGTGWNSFDPDNTPLPATMQVDYVRVWS